MLAQEQSPLWQANYKSMSPAQLTGELLRISENPDRYDQRTERITFLAHELALRRRPPDAAIILME